MIIHFTASESNLDEDLKYFKEIRRSITAADCTLALDWLKEAEKHKKISLSQSEDERDWALIHKRNIDALHKADLCIIESSARSFSVGFQTALALQLQKPTLVLTRNDSLRNSFGSGIVSSLLTYRGYTKDKISSIVQDFVSENNLKAQDLRFNFVIDKEIHNYLRWAAFKNNTTKAEVVRQLLRARIEDNL